MGSLIGVLSTVILVSTVCTLIFAVGAYVVSRKSRTGVGAGDVSSVPGDDVLDSFPQTSQSQAPKLFKRVTPSGGAAEGVSQNSHVDSDYQWK